MKRTYHVNFGAYIVSLIVASTLAKSFDEVKSFGDDSKLRCSEANAGSEYSKNTPNLFADYYKPRSNFDEAEKIPIKPLEYEEKRSPGEDFTGETLQKRQVGVIYKDDKPIGILQPFQRSYRFIPVKEEKSNGVGDEPESYTLPHSEVNKRDVNSINPTIAESYPLILTNFKIGSKLDKKRNYEEISDDNVRDLKATIRKLRSSNPHNAEQIEEELKSILDDMGLIDDDEVQKREAADEDDNEAEIDIKSDPDKEKRNDVSIKDSSPNIRPDTENLLTSEERRGEKSNEILAMNRRGSDEDDEKVQRKKRQKQEPNMGIDRSELENLKNSGSQVGGYKSPVSSPAITIRDAEDKEDYDDDYEKRVERNIQNKINTLREEVKREIQAYKMKQNVDEDTQRKKRQVIGDLVNAETDEINPALNPDGDLKPVIRKRRDNSKRTKRETASESTLKKDEESGGELLGDDFEESAVSKRNTRTAKLSKVRNKRSRVSDSNLHRYKRFYKNRRSKRFLRSKSNRLRPRFRRRVENKPVINRPQQLSDMSAVDLFGALPKSYEGELSRFKRVRRN